MLFRKQNPIEFTRKVFDTFNLGKREEQGTTTKKQFGLFFQSKISSRDPFSGVLAEQSSENRFSESGSGPESFEDLVKANESPTSRQEEGLLAFKGNSVTECHSKRGTHRTVPAPS